MTILGCGAEMAKLMAVSDEDVQTIEDVLKERLEMGVPRPEAQRQAVAEAIAIVTNERAMVMGAISAKIAALPAPAKPVGTDGQVDAKTQARADLENALADLGDIFSKPFKSFITPEQEQKLVPVLTRVLDAAFRLGYAKFKDAAKFALDKIAAALGADVADALTLGHLQGAYIAMAGGKQGSEGIMEVAKITSKEEIAAHTAMTDAERNTAPAEVSAQVRADAKAAGAEAATDLFQWASKTSTRATVESAVFESLFDNAPSGTPGLTELAQQITDELALEYSDQKADTDVKDTQNDPGTEKQGSGTLDGVPSAEVGGTGSAGPGGRGTRPGSKSRRKGNSSADGGRGASGRGGRSGAAGPDTASTGEPGGRSGVAGSGGGIPADGGAPDVKLPAGSKRGPRPGAPSLFTENGEVIPAAVPAANFTITPDLKLGSGGETVKYRDNIAAIRTLKLIEAEHRRATPDEQRTLARYVGWGGLANAFRNRVTGAVKADWAAEVAELESLLTAKELKAASASTPNAHYTSETVTGFMWRAAQRLGFSGGMVLEPSVGSGNFLGLMPESARKGSYITGIELDSITARIAAALYPQSNIVESGFEKLPLPENTFDLAIGNPPFGKIDLRFQYNPKLNGKSIHNQFFLGSMDAVKPGGLQVMVVSRYLMDAQDSGAREALALQAELIGAIRLPGSAFKGNAGTEVVTDILFLKKRTEADAKAMLFAFNERRAKIPAKESYGDRAERLARAAKLREAMDWTGTSSIPDPLGGEPMIVSTYFAKNPGMVAGVMDRSGSMQFGGDIDVKLPASELQGRLDALLEMLPSTEPTTASEEVDLRTQAMHKALGESLSIMASGREVGSIYYDESGALTEIVERVGLGGKTIVSKNVISASTPWSAQLSMNMEGKWFKEVAQLDEKGEKVKVGVKINPKTGKASKGRNVYVREVFENDADIPAGMRLGEVGFAKLQKLVAIRELYVEQINLETNAATTEKMESNREKLRSAYEAFVADHGYISEQKNATIISEMPDEGLMLSLELKFRPAVSLASAVKRGIKPRPASAQQNAILTKAVAIPPGRKDSAASVSDAVAIVLGESGRIDVARVAELLGKTEDDALSDLTGGESPIAYMDPETNEVTEKNQYLSGNVRKKLLAAQEAGLKRNVAALEKVQPEAWSSDKVTAHMGASWIPPAIYADFVSSLLGRDASVSFSAITNTFEVSSRGESAVDVSRWGTQRVPAVDLLNLILNSRRVAVYDGGYRDIPRVLNETETQSAIDKKKEIIEEFDNWVFKDGDRRQQIVRLFNDLYNTRVNRQYDGAHMVFPGKVPDSIIKFRRSQTNAVWRGIVDDFVMYDHAVGAGKTFTGIARVMERKRMGLSNKPTVVVPNHLVSEWATQAYRLYPGAKILAAGVKDLEPKNRRRLFAKIAAGNWDIVILPHSSFKFISIAPETEERFIEDELRVAREALADAEADAEPGQRFNPLSVKAAEALIVKLENRIDSVRGRAGKDMLLTFEQMGIDDLTIDESHEFKNLTYTTKLTDVRGLGPAAGSQKAFDLYTKMRILHETGGSAAFLTGTPISNSAVEMYTIMRYLAPDVLRDSGLEHFDAFRAQFVEASEKPEPTEAGDGLKVVNRLGRNWSNMRSLMDGYYSVADVVTNDDIKKWFAEDNPGKVFPLPNVKGGGRRTVKAIPTATQQKLIDELIAGYNNLPNIENMKERNAARLRLMDMARKVALHAKVWDKSLTDESGGKLDMVVDEAIRIYKAFEADKGAQLIFLDRSVPKAQGDDRLIKEYDALRAKMAEAVAEDDERGQREAIEALEKFDPQEIDELRTAQAGGWNAYQHMADGLIAKGVPKEQIAFIQNYNTDAEKKALFEAVNDGAIRFLFGSSARMGAGMNVQERLVGLHHVDVTWKPSDIEQREGRIIRQGNYFFMPDIDGEPNPMYRADFEVEIMAYVTERSIDAKMWDLNSTKLRMVNGIRYYDGEFEMDFDDDAAIDMAEIAAIASGDPLMLERIKVNTLIEELYRKRRSFNRRIESAGDSLRQAERTVETYPGQIIKAKALMVPARKAIEDANLDQSQRSVTIGGEKFRFLQTALASATEAIKVLKEGDTKKAFALEIDGENYTSEAGVMDAIAQKLGDVDPFVAEIAGEKVIRRTAVAREMRRIIGDTFTEVPSTPIGSLYGFPLRMATHDGYAGSKYATLAVDIPYSGGTEHINASWDITPEKHKKGTPVPVLTSSLRVVVDRLAERIDRIGKDTYEISSMERNLEEAKANIPTFREAVKEKFKHADELDEAVSRLDDIQSQLQARANAATSGPVAPVSAPDASSDGGGADVVFSRGTPFYSELSRQIEAANINAAPGFGWKATLKGLMARGVKADEITWSGIEEWLDLQTGKVTKAAVLEYLAGNGVQVTETTLGQPDEADIEALLNDEAGEGMTREEAIEYLGNDEGGTPTKYSKYTLPGGQNYREVLLTLPGMTGKQAVPRKAIFDEYQPRLDALYKVAQSGYSQDAKDALEKYYVLQKERDDKAKAAAGEAPDYKSSHWDQPNVLAHIRVNDRTDSNGKRVLFVEEIQSDWGQAGKREGFATPDIEAKIAALNKQYEANGDRVAALNKEAAALSDKELPKFNALMAELDSLSATNQGISDQINALYDQRGNNNSPPSAPFVDKTDKWLALALKRIVKLAVDGGYDKVAFVNGEQSAERYDLSKTLSKVTATRFMDGKRRPDTVKITAEDRAGNEVIEESFLDAGLEEAVGKELAARILADGGEGVYSGLDLKVGGEGMKAFYDQIVPSATKALLKKLGGGHMESVSIDGESKYPRHFQSEKAATDWANENLGDHDFTVRGLSETFGTFAVYDEYTHKYVPDGKIHQQPGFTITPAMQEKASGGLPLFAKNTTQFSPAAQAQSVQSVEKLVDGIMASWENGPRVVVAFDMQDARIPERIRLEDKKQRSGGAQGAPEGFYYDGTAYLMASQLKTPNDTARVLFHEALGHFGLRRAFGGALKPILQQIVTMRRAQVDAKVKEYGLRGVSNLDRLTAAEEVLAEMAQTTPEIGFVKRAIAAIRTWLRAHVPGFKDLALTDDEIIRSYILPARGWVERGPGGGGGPRGGLAFSRGAKGAMSNSQVGSAFKAMVKQARSDLEGVLFNWQEVELNEDGDRMVSRPGRDRFYSKGKEGGAVSVTKRSFIEWLQSEGPFDTKIYGPDIAKDAEWVQQIKTLRGLIQGEQNGPEVRFSREKSTDQTMTAAFKAWFGGSKVVNADGKPLVVYHGTQADFAVFDEEMQGSTVYSEDVGFFFTNDPAEANSYATLDWDKESPRPNTMPVFLSIKNPKIVTLENEQSPYDNPAIWYDKEGREAVQEAMDAGNDGLIVIDNREDMLLADGKKPTLFVAFRPEQIKSAIGNNGNFDPTNPDIRFSRAATARDLTQKATEAVRVFTNTPGKVNWWHKTVGTQYNLAQRSPEFKRVYDAVQDFIGDVSFYATEAADLAPKILPKLDTWRDIAKSPLSAEDTKAIAAPIFEGTLVWTRDEAGQPVKIKQMEDEAALMSSDKKSQRLLRNDKISEGVLKMWRGLPMEQYEALIDGKYEKEMLKAGVVWSKDELRSRFSLTDGQIDLYREFRAATDKSLTNLAISDMLYFGGKDVAPIKEAVLEAKTVNEAAEMLRDYLLSLADMDPANAESLIATANKMIDKGDRAADLMARGYAPLSRFGTYTLDVVDADGERVYFGLFESRFEADRMAKQMAAEYPGSTVEQGTLSEESYKLFAGVSPETVALFGDMLGLEDNGAYQDYLKLAKSTRSAMKRLIERKGIAGFSEDAGRVLAGFVYSNARQTSQNMHTGEMAQAANEIPKGMGELKDKATQLVEYIKNPVEEAQRIRGLLFAQYIGGSVASAMVNMTQPLTMTMPWLTQFGGLAKASKQMSAGVRDALRKTTGDKALDAALKRGEEDGTVSPQEVHDLMRQAQGKGALKSGDGTRVGDAAATAQNAVSRIAFAWGKLFSAAEQFNRRATFIAAYRTAVEQGMKNPDAFARRAIFETQGVYNKGNKPDWARGAVGATLFTFKQYSIAYVEMLHRMATTGAPGSPERAAGRRGALYALAVLMLLSGLGGMPGADDLDDIISGLMQALGYNFDSKAKRKAFLAEYLGDGAQQFIERGVSGIAGVPIDISGRLGLGNLIPSTGLLTKKTDHTSDVVELLGPAGDLAKRAFQAGGKLIDGDVLGNHGAIATASPKAVQNLFQAADMANTGMYRDARGKKVMETSPGDALSKALGFQPNDVKRQQDASWEVQRMIGLNRITEARIADQWAVGLFEKDAAKVQAARDDLAKWNADNPSSPIKINLQQIRQRVNAMNMTKAERIAKTAPKEIKATVRSALAQYEPG